MSIFDRKPALRWVAPLAAVLVVGGTGGIMAVTASADSSLPDRSAAQLLVDLQQTKVDAMSGTVVQDSNLGIPSLPGTGGGGDASLTSLISGSHTLHVWYAGPDKARLRVQGSLDETDVIKNGSDLWTWSFKDKTATHRTISADKSAKQTNELPADLPKTPQEAAAQVLKAIDPTTKISTDPAGHVAGRAVYELVLEPKDAGSKVSQVRIAIDGTEHIPLRVEVMAAGVDKPAFEVAYTAVDFNRPDDAQFTFNPPPDTKVTEVAPNSDQANADKAAAAKKAHADKSLPEANQPKIVGQGWTTVVVTKMPAPSATDKTAAPGPNGDSNGQLEQMLSKLPTVSGTWGSGKLLSGTAFSAVITDDGRVAVGSVQPDVLYAALTK